MSNKATNPARLVFRICILFIIGLAFTSCKTSNTLGDEKIIQKRKYQKGYHVNLKTPFEPKKESIRQIDLIDRSPTASVEAKNELNPENTEQVYATSDDLTLTLSEKESNSYSDRVTHETELDEYVDASLTPSTSFVTKPIFPGFEPVNQTATAANDLAQDPEYYKSRRLNTLALLSFVFGVLSFFILGLPFGVAAVVLGIIGIVQIENNPTQYKGKGFAIIGLIIGIIAVIVMVTY